MATPALTPHSGLVELHCPTYQLRPPRLAANRLCALSDWNSFHLPRRRGQTLSVLFWIQRLRLYSETVQSIQD